MQFVGKQNKPLGGFVVNEEKIRYFELAIAFYGSLPEDLKMRILAQSEHDQNKLLFTINGLALRIKNVLELPSQSQS